MLLVDEKEEMTLVHELTLVAVNENTENTSCTRKQNSTLHAALENKYFFYAACEYKINSAAD